MLASLCQQLHAICPQLQHLLKYSRGLEVPVFKVVLLSCFHTHQSENSLILLGFGGVTTFRPGLSVPLIQSSGNQ